ncbi:MAG: Ig-like domain-containing protein, partial [Myxococcota bacterium]|nr:Ig-like domain-containing protein [Myxococcota bacterium]
MNKSPLASLVTLVLASLLVAGGASLLLATGAAAFPGYNAQVNAFCEPDVVPAPPNDCAFCHVDPSVGNYDRNQNGLDFVTGRALGGDYSLLCPPVIVNNAPMLAAIGDRMGTEGQGLSFTISATDPDGDGLAFSATGLPAGASFVDQGDGTADFDWTPAFGDAGVYSVTFRVDDDGDPVMSATETISITVFNGNRAPTLAAVGDQNVDEGQNLTVNLSATDLDGDTLTFQAGGVPTGAVFTDLGGGNARLTWTPGFDQTGNYPVTFTVTDDGNPVLNDSETISISVGNVNRAPALNPIGAKNVDEGQSLSFAIGASDPDGDSVTLSAASVPAGANFTDNGNGTGSFDWTPGFDDVGNYDVIFTASDPSAANASETVTLTVGDVNRAPVLAPIGNQAGSEGQALVVSINASDPDGDVLSFQAAGLPAGAVLNDGGDGSATVNWTPAFGDTGNHSITVTVSDDGD